MSQDGEEKVQRRKTVGFKMLGASSPSDLVTQSAVLPGIAGEQASEREREAACMCEHAMRPST